jgi:hypothetical protein
VGHSVELDSTDPKIFFRRSTSLDLDRQLKTTSPEYPFDPPESGHHQLFELPRTGVRKQGVSNNCSLATSPAGYPNSVTGKTVLVDGNAQGFPSQFRRRSQMDKGSFDLSPGRNQKLEQLRADCLICWIANRALTAILQN